jgi:lipase ATG15
MQFRESHTEFAESFVSYELVSFPADSSAIVLVRGTKTFFDYFADAKLWYSTALFQVFREAIPFGDFFTPLIRFNIGALSLLETSSIKESAYYMETSAFIQYLKERGDYNSVLITGHSLGGGIALISGAQTQSKAVGLSAPNTVLGRGTVYPKLELHDLYKYTFNIVPERGE